MKCPVCAHKLHEYQVNTFQVYICRDGCAGMWFDAGGLELCDQHGEAFPEQLLRLRRVPDVLIDRSKIRQCPRCPQTDLARVVLDPDIRFEIDKCPSCSGHWLDVGELEFMRDRDMRVAKSDARISSHQAAEEDRVKLIDAMYKVGGLVKKFLS